MKSATIYLLALSMLATVFLAGCGNTAGDRDDAAPQQGTNVLPDADELLPEGLVPDAMEPDVNDGTVHDTDGFITDSDNEYGKMGDGSTALTPFPGDGRTDGSGDQTRIAGNTDAADSARGTGNAGGTGTTGGTGSTGAASGNGAGSGNGTGAGTSTGSGSGNGS